MVKLKKGDVFAGIDIGSNSISMTLSMLQKNKTMKNLEYLTKTVEVGADTYALHKVDAVRVDQICEALKGFNNLLLDYDVPFFRVVATTAIKEAQNSDYIIDRVKLKTGLNVDLIDDAEERFLIYKCLDEELPGYGELKKEGALVAYIGSGNVQLSVYDKGHLVFEQTIKIGIMRVREMLSEFENRYVSFANILNEYLSSRLNPLLKIKQWEKIENVIIVSPESGLWERMPTDVTARVSRSRFDSTYKEILNSAASGRSDTSLPAILLAKQLLELTGAKAIRIPDVRLCDGIIYDLADKLGGRKRDNKYVEDMLCAARFLAKRFNCDEAHYQYIENIALHIFDCIASAHFLNVRDKVLMQAAATLYECGKFISINNAPEFSYQTIHTKFFIGLSDVEVNMVALMAKYLCQNNEPVIDTDVMLLPLETRIKIAKLTAILRLAKALDISKKQKIKAIKVYQEEELTVVEVTHIGDLSLEEWDFEKQAAFFKETLGLNAVLKPTKKGGAISGA